MTNVVQQIEHPAIGEIRKELEAKYETELAQVTKRAEEAEERISDAESVIEDEREVINRLWDKIKDSGDGDIRKGKIDLAVLKEGFGEFSPKRYQKDYSVMDEISLLLEHIELPPPQVITDTQYKEVEVLPKRLRINGEDYILDS